MPALLINVRIDAKEKFDFFRVTLSDLAGLFEECHIKIRGSYSQDCVDYAKDLLHDLVRVYQELPEGDWVDATLEMARQVKSRSVFLYFEDHRLVASKEQLRQILADFDVSNLDYLCYSFFKASQLDVRNLLPLGPVQRESFSEFDLSSANVGLLGQISPNYYTFSLLSIFSIDYFKLVLGTENKRVKIFSKLLTGLVTRLMRPHRSRKFLKGINAQLSRFQAMCCLHHPATPFNLEKLWFESILGGRKWKYAIPKIELYANFDDDNGVYEESLIKRGLYPFKPHEFDREIGGRLAGVAHQMTLNAGEGYDCTYYSHNARIHLAPIVAVSVARGSIAVHYQRETIILTSGETRLFYSNLGPVIQCRERAEVELRVFDEAFH